MSVRYHYWKAGSVALMRNLCVDSDIYICVLLPALQDLRVVFLRAILSLQNLFFLQVLYMLKSLLKLCVRSTLHVKSL